MMMIVIKIGFRATGFYAFDVNAVNYSICKGHIINNASNGTDCNEAPKAALPNLSIEDFH